MNYETFVLFPWLQLKKQIDFPSVSFVPIGDEIGFAHLSESATTQIKLILSSYVDLTNQPVPACTIAVRKTDNSIHDLNDQEFEDALEYSLLLFFCTWAKNDYIQVLGNYVNSSIFEILGQRVVANNSKDLALNTKRRDGRTLGAGYKHGTVRFSAPPHYDRSASIEPDIDLLDSLIEARSTNTQLYKNILASLNFVQLANTDRNFMRGDAEVILMSSAFETLFEVSDQGKAKEFATKFSNLFDEHSKNLNDAIKSNRLQSVPDEMAGNWLITKAWAFEFYKLRNHYIHYKTSTRVWGWNELEHLIMAAFSLPLIVKHLLAANNLYNGSKEYSDKLSAIPDLLIVKDWFHVPNKESHSSWQITLNKTMQDLDLNRDVTDAYNELAQRSKS